jgi:hypothetical protein
VRLLINRDHASRLRAPRRNQRAALCAGAHGEGRAQCGSPGTSLRATTHVPCSTSLGPTSTRTGTWGRVKPHMQGGALIRAPPAAAARH